MHVLLASPSMSWHVSHHEACAQKQSSHTEPVHKADIAVHLLVHNAKVALPNDAQGLHSKGEDPIALRGEGGLQQVPAASPRDAKVLQ